MLKKVRQKQSVLSLVPIMSREEVFKFPDRLGRNCGFTQVAPVSHSPWEEVVCLTKFNLKQFQLFLANCVTLFWFSRERVLVLCAIAFPVDVYAVIALDIFTPV